MSQLPAAVDGTVEVPLALPDTGSTDDMAALTGPVLTPMMPAAELPKDPPSLPPLSTDQEASIRATKQVAAYIQPDPEPQALMQTVVVKPTAPAPPVTPGVSAKPVPSVTSTLLPDPIPAMGTTTPTIVPAQMTQRVEAGVVSAGLPPAAGPSPFPPAPPPPTPTQAFTTPVQIPQLPQADVPSAEARTEEQIQLPYHSSPVTAVPKAQPAPTAGGAGGKIVSQSADAPLWFHSIQRFFGMVMGVGILTVGGYLAITRLDWQVFLSGITSTPSISEGVSPQTVVIPGGLLIIGVVFLGVGFVLQKESAD